MPDISCASYDATGMSETPQFRAQLGTAPPPPQFPSVADRNAALAIPLSNRSYNQQYAHIYFLRLTLLRPKLQAAAATKWAKIAEEKNARHIPKVLDIRPGEPCWIIGTVYCEMKYKPNIFEELNRQQWGAPLPVHYAYNDASDVVTLEDESGRVALSGFDKLAALSLRFVTGAVVAVLGVETTPGTFELLDVCVPDLPPQIPVGVDVAVAEMADESTVAQPGSKLRPETNSATYVALISGLRLENAQEGIETQLLKEYLAGELGGAADRAKATQITQLVIAGNSVAETYRSEVARVDLSDRQAAAHLSGTPPAISAFDEFLADILPSIPVAVMPGAADPTCFSVPQQPLHPALLPRSRETAELLSLTGNPAWFQWGEIRAVGTSGQNVADMAKYLLPENRLRKDLRLPEAEFSVSSGSECGDPISRVEMLEDTLLLQHLFPTAPDTLWCYPFKDADPFMLRETPHVLFAGNQPKFETKMVVSNDTNGSKVFTRLICVPEFCERKEIVLLNLSDLTCEVVSFSQGL